MLKHSHGKLNDKIINSKNVKTFSKSTKKNQLDESLTTTKLIDLLTDTKNLF